MSRASSVLLVALKSGSPEFRRLNRAAFERAEQETQRMAGRFDVAMEQVAMAKTEKQLQGQLEGLLRRNGVQMPIRQRMDRKSNVAVGIPDILFSIPGVGAIAWEVKLPGQHPRPEQELAHAAMRADGWRVDVVRTYAEGLALLLSFLPDHSGFSPNGEAKISPSQHRGE